MFITKFLPVDFEGTLYNSVLYEKCQTEDETLKPTSCFICSSADICIE